MSARDTDSSRAGHEGGVGSAGGSGVLEREHIDMNGLRVRQRTMRSTSFLWVLAAVPFLTGVHECEPGGEPGPAIDGGPAPCACPEVWAPVCGADGVTYGNECEARCAGAPIAHSGECSPTLCLADADCGPDERCNHDVCLSPCAPGEICPAVCYGACEAEKPECPPACFLHCDYGHVLDPNGCPTCECAPPPACPPVLCDIHCEHGYVQDANGCDTCECAPPPACEPVACRLHCEHGWAVDERGCEICACAPPPACPPVLCDVYCEHGHVPDERGCDTCACIEPR